MAVLFAEGFTGIARADRNFVEGITDPMYKLGWQLQGRHSGTSAIASDGNVKTQIVADPIFATRNVYRMAKTGSSTVGFFNQARQTIDTRGFTKFVIGGVFQYDTAATDGNSGYIDIGGPTLWTSSASGFPFGDVFAQLIIPNNGANGQAQAVIDGSNSLVTSPELVKGKPVHFEVLLEIDVKRCRVYLNGTLTLDITLPSAYVFAKADSGISLIFMAYPQSASAPLTCAWSNIYLLGIDSVHTGILGPATRVLEVAPATDVDVHFDRPDSFATNAAVMAQNFDATTPGMLTAGDPGVYDIYNSPDAVAANAAQVYGAGFRVLAMSMAEGSHALKPTVKNATGVEEVGAEMPLTLGSTRSGFMDMSVNPATSAIWTPSQLRDVGFGIKLIR